MAFIVTAHEDRFIRIFDIVTGAIHSIMTLFIVVPLTSVQLQVNVHTRCPHTWMASPRCRSTPLVSRLSLVRTTARYASGICSVRGHVRRKSRRTEKRRERACWTSSSTPRYRSWRALVRTVSSNFTPLHSFLLPPQRRDCARLYYDSNLFTLFFFSSKLLAGMLTSAHVLDTRFLSLVLWT